MEDSFTLRDILSGLSDAFGGLSDALLADINIVLTQNILDWPIYMAVLVVLLGFGLAGTALSGIIAIFLGAADAWERNPFLAAITRIFAYIAPLALVWFLLFIVIGVPLAAADSSGWFEQNTNVALGLVLGLPTLVLAVLEWLRQRGRRAMEREERGKVNFDSRTTSQLHSRSD